MAVTRELLHELVDSLPEQKLREAAVKLLLLLEKAVSETHPRGQRYARTLQLLGRVHSDYTDVSSDKHKHLAEIYATIPKNG